MKTKTFILAVIIIFAIIIIYQQHSIKTMIDHQISVSEKTSSQVSETPPTRSPENLFKTFPN